ncbi:sigma-70 family RNA polymerase sigma factor [Virgibacillus sp. W0181]|uniref:sigma-70 family RNA polymerase sigma factor n=1 Tax=Virgibacillus sp. W0181 TaxID=3391581 RepID=UPI003F48F15E
MVGYKKMDFEEIVKQNERRIYFYIHKLDVKDPHKEFYQEGLVAMWNAYETYRPDKGPLATYFNYTIRNRMIDLLRKKKREQDAKEAVVKEESQKIDLGNRTRKRETTALIHDQTDIPVTDTHFWQQVKNRLTKNQWKWVYYFIVENIPIKDIAEQEGVSVEAVKSWGKQARKKLRKVKMEV